MVDAIETVNAPEFRFSLFKSLADGMVGFCFFIRSSALVQLVDESFRESDDLSEIIETTNFQLGNEEQQVIKGTSEMLPKRVATSTPFLSRYSG